MTSFKKINEREAIALLKKHSTDKKSYEFVLAHVKKVAHIAARTIRRINKKNPNIKIDSEFVKIGSLLHDIGRFQQPPGKKNCEHGYLGGLIIKKEGLDPRLIRVCETHVGYWLSKQDVISQKINIPKKSYKPQSIEEKIISYADKIVSYDKEISYSDLVERYQKKHGEKSANRLLLLNNEMKKLM